jgi:RES domain-containing protein
MRLWRICRARYAAQAYSGEGARLFGGRWNSKGLHVIYASTSLALAAVETFVNLEPKLLPDDLVSIQAELADIVATERLEAKALPAHWYKARGEALRHFGDEWIRAQRTVALYVPSAAIRSDWNVLLNPAHADFRKLKAQKPQPFEFDLRMFR